VDAALAFVLGLAGLGSLASVATEGHAAAVARLAPFVVAMFVAVVFRRKSPVIAFAVGALGAAGQVLFGPGDPGSSVPVLVLLYTLAAYEPRRVSVPGLVICVVGAAATFFLSIGGIGAAERFLLATVFSSGTALVAWVIGDSMRYRRAYLRSLEDRAARLERERDAQAQIAAAAERARIARELHDVIAHNVSVMVVQADGASYALRTEPERAGQALAAISQTGRLALSEMRRLLGVLRSGDEQADLAPVPGLDQLRELVDQARAAGMSVSLTLDGPPRPLAEGAELAAYRVVQESLTNTRKHGGLAAAARVALRYEPDGLMLQVTDDGLGAAAPSDGPGHGRTGMRERIEMYGGTVQAGPRPGGGYQVTARLPDSHADSGLAPRRARLDGAA
jgi:signal transduction histidine kinase